MLRPCPQGLESPMCSKRRDVRSIHAGLLASKTGHDLETLVRRGEAGMCAMEAGMQADEEIVDVSSSSDETEVTRGNARRTVLQGLADMGFALDIRQAATDAHPDDLHAAAIWATEFAMTATLVVPAHTPRRAPHVVAERGCEDSEARHADELLTAKDENSYDLDQTMRCSEEKPSEAERGRSRQAPQAIGDTAPVTTASLTPATQGCTNQPPLWRAAWPPSEVEAAISRTRSWLHVLLLLHVAGLLQREAAQAWCTHPVIGQDWRRAARTLQASGRVSAATLGENMRCVRALTSEQGMSECAQAHAARPVALANATEHFRHKGPSEALLTQYGGHEVVLLMNSIERAMRMGSAAAEGCAIMSRLVGRPCYRADPEGEVAWWTTRLIEMQTPAEALCMWLSIPLHTEYVENATFAEVTDAVLRDIANLRNARIPVQAACSMACRLGCILPLPLAVAFSFCARASAKPENFIMDIALALLANVLRPRGPVSAN